MVSDDDDEEEDDTEALLAELERIKKERAEENLRKVCIGNYLNIDHVSCICLDVQLHINQLFLPHFFSSLPERKKSSESLFH